MTIEQVRDILAVACYPIMHDGEGERGKPIRVCQLFSKGAGDYAEEAAHVLDELDMMHQGAGIAEVGAWHGGSHVIEVVGHPRHHGPLRFRVRCEVVRRYSAEQI